MSKLLKKSFETTFTVHGYHVYKDIGKLNSSSEMLSFFTYLHQIITKIITATIHVCFEAPGIVSLAALVIADGSASDNAFRLLHMAAPA